MRAQAGVQPSPVAISPSTSQIKKTQSKDHVGIVKGSAAYRRINIALFAAGFCTFSLMYGVQAILPLFAQTFHVSAAESALALSLTTGFVALSIVLVGTASENFGRKELMSMSMLGAAVLNLLAAFAPNWHVLLVIRALEGIMLGGVPAVAMAYLAEEIHPKGLGLAMGLYVGGNAIGGMVARVTTGYLAEVSSWRVAMGVMGGLCLVLALVFKVLLPASKNFKRQTEFKMAFHIHAFRSHLLRPELVVLFAVGFLMMGAFVTVYNYAGFRLLASPFNLSATQVGFIFMAYIFGAIASSLAGEVADRFGRYPVLILGILLTALGVGLTLSHVLVLIVIGIIVMTIGFFTTHSIASSWVGRMAIGTKGHATSLYLLAYYMGASVMGALGGWFWDHGAWISVVEFTGVLLILALIAALVMRRFTQAPTI